jgi:UDP-GlcNAc3NAcA epimerase
MDIPEPEYNPGINSVSHGAMTGRMLEGIEKVLLKEKPSSVVVFGDTDSTLAGALAAGKLGIPVAHVEAELRSYNMSMPEEINRVLTDRISYYLFCPTDTAVKNLQREGFGNFNVRVENTGDLSRLKSIIASLNRLSEEYRIVFPLHPWTKKILERERITLDFSPVDPVGYFDIIELLKHCAFVITDSGGLQKEAFFFGKQCLVTRQETEWTELVDLGYNFLVDVNIELIIQKAAELKNSKKDFREKPYGEGNAAEKNRKDITRNIVNSIIYCKALIEIAEMFCWKYRKFNYVNISFRGNSGSVMKIQKFFEHAKHNEKACNFINTSSTNEFNDWVITIAFYSAVHYINQS